MAGPICGLCGKRLKRAKVVHIAGTPVCRRCRSVDADDVRGGLGDGVEPSLQPDPIELVAQLTLLKKHGSPTFSPTSRRWLLVIGAIALLVGVIRALAEL